MDNRLPSPDLEEIDQDEPFTPITTESHYHKRPPPFKIPRVDPRFRKEEVRPDTYDPIFISLGPYHHGKPELRHGETLKCLCMDWFISGSRCKDKFFFYGKILECIDEIRDCYEEEVIQEYDDQALAFMILHDACVIFIMLRYVHLWSNGIVSSSAVMNMSVVDYNSVRRDMLLLENQIPLWIIKFLACLHIQSDQGQRMWDEMLASFLAFSVPGVDVNPAKSPWAGEEKYEPAHLLDAIGCYKVKPIVAHYLLYKDSHLNIVDHDDVIATELHRRQNYQFRSTTNLRSKGIQVSASNSDKQDTESISFISHFMHGRLHIPCLVMGKAFFILYSNLIAYDLSPSCGLFVTNPCLFTSYVNFIKSLIESPNDAKILREDGVLFSGFIGSDDEVVKAIKDLNTLGVENSDIFSELKTSINEHCSSKRKTWLADLIHTYFASPWTFVGFFAAFGLFVLTFLQTFFTIHPAN